MVRILGYVFLVLGVVLIAAAALNDMFGVNDLGWPDVVNNFINRIDGQYLPGFGAAAVGILLLLIDRRSSPNPE